MNQNPYLPAVSATQLENADPVGRIRAQHPTVTLHAIL
jgi:hypothetical protein